MDKKKERFIRELDQRTSLWGRMKANAERRVELDDIHTPLAKIDVEVAERALIRIAKKKDEVLGVPLAEEPNVEYPALEVVLRKEKELMEKAPKKRVHKKPKALFELAPAKDVEEKEEHDA